MGEQRAVQDQARQGESIICIRQSYTDESANEAE